MNLLPTCYRHGFVPAVGDNPRFALYKVGLLRGEGLLFLLFYVPPVAGLSQRKLNVGWHENAHGFSVVLQRVEPLCLGIVLVFDLI